MTQTHYDYLIPAKRIKVVNKKKVVKPVKCPFSLTDLDEIGCLYLHSNGTMKGQIKNQCWRVTASFADADGTFTSIHCRLDSPPKE
jgi:hypothetical protein